MGYVEDDQINSLVFNYLVQLDSKLARDFKEEAGGRVNEQFLTRGSPSLGDVVKFFLKKDKQTRTRGKQVRKRISVSNKPLKIKSVSSKKSKKKVPKTRQTTRFDEKLPYQENNNSELLSVEEIETGVNSDVTENSDAKVSEISLSINICTVRWCSIVEANRRV